MTEQMTAPLPLRDEDGAIRADFVAEAAHAVATADVPALRELVDGLHESDLGGLLVALKPDDRPRLIELLNKL